MCAVKAKGIWPVCRQQPRMSLTGTGTWPLTLRYTRTTHRPHMNRILGSWGAVCSHFPRRLRSTELGTRTGHGAHSSRGTPGIAVATSRRGFDGLSTLLEHPRCLSPKTCHALAWFGYKLASPRLQRSEHVKFDLPDARPTRWRWPRADVRGGASPIAVDVAHRCDRV